MVLLTMTRAIVAAVQSCNELNGDAQPAQAEVLDPEPDLQDPDVGKPISHNQLIKISKLLKDKLSDLPKEDLDGLPSATLNDLLRGTSIYRRAPKPKAEPTPEYKALMLKLKAEEEARAYQRMINPPPPQETFAQRFAGSPYASLFPSGADLQEEADEVTYADVNRQLALIINVLVSIICCAVAIWIAARHWSVPRRLFLSMGGSGLVAVAEVVIYNGYISRVREAKVKEKKRPEKKQLIESWTTNTDNAEKSRTIIVKPAVMNVEPNVRLRRAAKND